MALTNNGFDGTVTEAAWAQMSALTDVDAVESSAAWAVTAGTGRQVSTAAQNGYAFAKGVLSKDTAAILTNLATPVNGQWFLIVRHIDWATNGVTVTAVAHTTTTTTVPTAPPATFPTVDNNPGVLYDQKLAWAWVNSVNTTVTLFDIRRSSDWLPFSPAYSGFTPGVGGSAVFQRRYVGEDCEVKFAFNMGTSGGSIGAIQFNLNDAIGSGYATYQQLGFGMAGSTVSASAAAGVVVLRQSTGTTTVLLFAENAATAYGNYVAMSATVPVTFLDGGFVVGSLSYRSV